jgi:hypothetical protein
VLCEAGPFFPCPRHRDGLFLCLSPLQLASDKPLMSDKPLFSETSFVYVESSPSAQSEHQRRSLISSRSQPRPWRTISRALKESAAVLYCEIGDITRFSSAKKLIAQKGLDPRREESGDIAREKTISKQGSSHIRSVLYGCPAAAIRNGSNPPVRDTCDRLRERGKHQKVAEVACMLWARGDRLRVLEQQRTVRPDLREALDRPARSA